MTFCARAASRSNARRRRRPARPLARCHELPIATQSIDLVVLPHVLEFADEPHQILREVDRVLMPEGRLVIVGFNPWSLWGAAQRARLLARDASRGTATSSRSRA